MLFLALALCFNLVLLVANGLTCFYRILQYKRIVRLGEWLECARAVRRADRRLMMKLRGGTAGFQIETGRWRGVTRQERVCKECDSGEVEDVDH